MLQVLDLGMDSGVPEPIQDFVEPFDEVEYFECDVELVNIQSLGLELIFMDFH